MRRRLILGAVAAVSVPPVAIGAVLAPAPAAPLSDAFLLADCARWHELAAVINGPSRPEWDKDLSELPEWSEWMAVERRIEAATPATAAGMVAMARVALGDDGAAPEAWADNTPDRIAFRILSALAGRA